MTPRQEYNVDCFVLIAVNIVCTEYISTVFLNEVRGTRKFVDAAGEQRCLVLMHGEQKGLALMDIHMSHCMIPFYGWDVAENPSLLLMERKGNHPSNSYSKADICNDNESRKGFMEKNCHGVCGLFPSLCQLSPTSILILFWTIFSLPIQLEKTWVKKRLGRASLLSLLTKIKSSVCVCRLGRES